MEVLQVANKNISDSEMATLEVDAGQLLAEQPKVKVKLYLAPEEKSRLQSAVENGVTVPWPSETVIVNGYTYVLKRGQECEVPQTVAEILEQAGMI
jgi:hypothetical protein